ncbi:MAG: hypothetical protein LAT54_02295 [Cryomorphaceae bacterium]|nr:hypothetical protein [Cryomorphaceae bacterium]
MNSFKNILSFFIAGSLFISSCSSDDDDHTIAPQPNKATMIFDMKLLADNNEVKRAELFSIDESYDFRLLETRFYVSNVELKNTSGDWVKSDPKILLLDIRNQGSDDFKITVPEGDYVEMRYLIGLDSATNRSYPTDFPREHPLSAFQATHWNWNLFYRFIIVEARVNTYGNFVPDTSTTAFNTNVSIHPGTDEMLVKKEHTFTETLNLPKNSSTKFILQVNTNDWLNGPGGSWDPMTENQGHAEPHDFELTKKFGANFGASVSLIVE